MTAYPLRSEPATAPPLPALIVCVCPLCEGDPTPPCPFDSPTRGAGCEVAGRCDHCGNYGQLTLNIGSVDGALIGYVHELNILVTFDNEADMFAGAFSSARRCDRLTLPDRYLLSELEVAL